MSDIFGQTAEVEAFLQAVDSGKKPKNFKKFIRNHKFKDNKLEVLNHYFMIINIPEKMAEHYHGVSVPVPRFGRHHKMVNGFGAWSNSKDFLKLFPNASVQDIKCTEDDSCLVCQRLAEQFERLGIEKVNKKWMAPDDLSINDQAIAKQLINGVDGSLKGKKKVVFAAIVFERDKDNKKQWNKSFERIVMSDFYWTRDFNKVLFESREEDKETWINEDHCDDTFTYNEETKTLSEFTEAEQGEIFLANTKSIVPIPWDMLDGVMLHYEEIGEVQEPGIVKVRKNYPYFPPQLIATAKGEVKKTLKAREDQATETYNWMIENIESLKDLDIDGYFPAKITAEDQYEILGVAKERTSDMGDVETKKTPEKASKDVSNPFDEETEEDEVGELGDGVDEVTTSPASEKVANTFDDDDFPF